MNERLLLMSTGSYLVMDTVPHQELKEEDWDLACTYILEYSPCPSYDKSHTSARQSHVFPAQHVSPHLKASYDDVSLRLIEK